LDWRTGAVQFAVTLPLPQSIVTEKKFRSPANPLIVNHI
jgi:hypothetical protein